MPDFLDFLFGYGSHDGEDRDLRYSCFRTETILSNPDEGNVIPDLERSGLRYQICYNLKAVSPMAVKKQGVPQEKWQIHRAAIQHQFDPMNGNQLWILGDPHAALKEKIRYLLPDHTVHKDMFDTIGNSFRSSLDIPRGICTLGY